jgi:hypothetical protein
MLKCKICGNDFPKPAIPLLLIFFQAKLSIVVMYYNFIKPQGTLSWNDDKSYTPRKPALVVGIIAKNRSINDAM